VKTCKRCEVEQPISAYTKHAATRDGLRAICRNCIHIERTSQKHKDYYKTWARLARQNPTYRARAAYSTTKRNALAKGYAPISIPIDAFLEWYFAQPRECAICKRTEQELLAFQNARPLVVDHDHKTGIPRALLCQRCNIIEGWLNDPITPRVLDYIERFAA